MTTIPTSTAETVHRANSSDASAVGLVLAAAFHDDPVFKWCVPDPGRRVEMLPEFFELTMTTVLAYDEVEVTDDRSAAALWVPPGRPPVPEAHAAAFDARLAELFGSDAERTFALMTMLDEHHPVDEHRFLWFVGVQPNRQGDGLGSTLLASMLARCDADEVATSLDATSVGSRRLYERHGFTVTAERSVDGSPPLWAMWRDPR